MLLHRVRTPNNLFFNLLPSQHNSLIAAAVKVQIMKHNTFHYIADLLLRTDSDVIERAK